MDDGFDLSADAAQPTNAPPLLLPLPTRPIDGNISGVGTTAVQNQIILCHLCLFKLMSCPVRDMATIEWASEATNIPLSPISCPTHSVVCHPWLAVPCWYSEHDRLVLARLNYLEPTG